MRCTLITLVALVLTCSAPATQASAGGWRFQRGWFRRGRQPVSYRTNDVSQETRTAPAGSDSQAPTATATRATHRSTPRKLAANSAHRSLSDEEKCALLGRERAHMVYPEYDDVDPYPVCRAWKWDDEDGWGWDWSELNCPWKQLRHPLPYDD